MAIHRVILTVAKIGQLLYASRYLGTFMHIINRLEKQQCSLQSAIRVIIEFPLIFGEINFVEVPKIHEILQPSNKDALQYVHILQLHMHRLSVCCLIYLIIQSITQLWYRFNAMLNSHASNRTPLVKCLNLIEYVFNRLELGIKLKLERKPRTSSQAK